MHIPFFKPSYIQDWLVYRHYPIVNCMKGNSSWRIAQRFNVSSYGKWWIPINLIIKGILQGNIRLCLTPQKPYYDMDYIVKDDWLTVNDQQAGKYLSVNLLYTFHVIIFWLIVVDAYIIHIYKYLRYSIYLLHEHSIRYTMNFYYKICFSILYFSKYNTNLMVYIALWYCISIFQFNLNLCNTTKYCICFSKIFNMLKIISKMIYDIYTGCSAPLLPTAHRKVDKIEMDIKVPYHFVILAIIIEILIFEIGLMRARQEKRPSRSRYSPAQFTKHWLPAACWRGKRGSAPLLGLAFAALTSRRPAPNSSRLVATHNRDYNIMT